MNSKRVFWILIGLQVLLAIGVIAGTVLGDSLLQKQSAKLVSLKLDSKVLDEQQTTLVQANKDIIKYADLEKIAKTVVPQEKDQARVVRQIISYAGDSGIPIQNITFPSSTLGQVQPKATTGASGSTGSSSTPVPTNSSASSQLKAVDGLTGVYQLEVTVQSDSAKPVTFSQLIDFLTKLENNRRTAQVTGIAVTPDAKNRKLITFSLIVDVYVKP